MTALGKAELTFNLMSRIKVDLRNRESRGPVELELNIALARLTNFKVASSIVKLLTYMNNNGGHII